MTVVPQLSLVLPNIRSAHNVGAMFRTADGCGFEKLYLCGYTATPPKVQIDKVSLGAETWMPWEHEPDILGCIQSLKDQGIQIVALEQTTESISLTSFEPITPLALIVGNEVDGLSEEILALVHRTVHIDMHGKKKSLNVSVAAGIAMHYITSHI